MKKERRRHTRVPVGFEVFVKIKRKAIPVKTLNLSMRGMRCSSDPLFADGASCTVVFALSSAIKLRINATILRASARQTGIHFESMDEDSFFHLKRLVQFNTKNPDTIDRELARYIKNFAGTGPSACRACVGSM